MTMRWFQLSLIGAATVLSVTHLPKPALAQDPNADCVAAVGTFLTRNRFTDQQGSEYRARSLISLTRDGHAFRNDSDQDAAEYGYSVGEGRGAWRCLGAEGSTVKLTATMLNFIYPKEDQNPALIGRMDYAGSFDTEDNVLRLNAKLGFVPLDADPFLGDIPANSIDVEIVGLKID